MDTGKTADEILAALPTPSLYTAKKSKPVKKRKLSAHKTFVKKAKKTLAKPAKVKRPAKQARKALKSAACVRSERLDMRLSAAEKAKLETKAKKLRRTVTSVVLEAIEKI